MTISNLDTDHEAGVLAGLNRLLHDAATLIRERGWVPLRWPDEPESSKPSWGPVTVFEALSESALSPLEHALAIIFLDADGFNGCWTVDERLTATKVLRRLGKTATPAGLVRCMGPDWGGGVRIAQACRTLSVDQRDLLTAAGKQQHYGEHAEAYSAAYYAAHGGLGFAFTELSELTGAAGPHEATNAARALLVRHRMGAPRSSSSGPEPAFGQAHYEALTRGWASVIGPVHPND